MNVYEIIKKKRDRFELSSDEISYIISGYTKGSIPDYQMSSLLMAVFLNGMTSDEIFSLTNSMLVSGSTINLNEINAYKIDKHSTGGVGDKISIILAPLVASLGVTVPMISGRGLGHTGGTLDKLESIPGFRTRISISEFKEILKKTGVAIVGQTEELVPADKKIYSLRDVTATVESIPLITASILSKKLASGLDGLLMDVKVGRGAFMKNLKDAKALALSLKRVMKKFDKDITCVLTNMDEPLGYAIGNSLEILECIDVLKGFGPKDIVSLTVELSAQMLKMAKIEKNLSKAKKLLLLNLKNGKALKKFEDMLFLQGGDPAFIKDPLKLGRAAFVENICLMKEGFISRIETEELGLAITRLGAGREKVSDIVDPNVGMVLNKKTADFLKKDEPIAVIHYNDRQKFEREIEKIKSCFSISPKPPSRKKLILEIN